MDDLGLAIKTGGLNWLWRRATFSNACGARRPLAQCFSHVGSQSFSASKHARLRRANATATFYCGRHERERMAIPTKNQPQMRGLPRIAENLEIKQLEALSAEASIPIAVTPIHKPQITDHMRTVLQKEGWELPGTSQ